MLNVAGNAILIYVFKMGVSGAATSTLVSRMFNAIVLLVLLRSDKNEISVRDYLKIRPHKHSIKKILAMGVPNGIENSMFQFGRLAIQSSVSTLGTITIAAQSMTVILENVNGVAGVGVGIGLMTIVGQCLGAGKRDEAIFYTKKMIKWGYIAVFASCLVAFSMIVSTLTMWFCRVSLATYLIRVAHIGAMGVWIGMFCDWGIRAIIFTIRFMSKNWIHEVV